MLLLELFLHTDSDSDVAAATDTEAVDGGDHKSSTVKTQYILICRSLVSELD